MKLVDTRSTPAYHLVIGLFSFFIVVIILFLTNDINRALAGTAFLLLFITLAIGPIMRIFKVDPKNLPWNFPWAWRREFAIWFTALGVLHALFVFEIVRSVPMTSSEIASAIALSMALIMVISSFEKVFRYIGLEIWKRIHGLAYVIFFLIGIHVINNSFLIPGKPVDFISWSYLVMIIVMIILYITDLFIMITDHRKEMN